MGDAMCIRCGITLKVYKQSAVIKCKECGAVYNLTERKLNDENVELDYDFAGFNCIHTTYDSTCSNACPAAQMYCKEHTSDESFESAKSSIGYAEKSLEAAKDVLEKMEESKKTWLIQEVSGIDEDNSIRED